MRPLFDLMNRMTGNPDTAEREKRQRRLNFAKNERQQKANPPRLQKAKAFVPTQNDPEYYAQRGAQSEGAAQSQVNEYREKKYPGVKPLYKAY